MHIRNRGTHHIYETCMYHYVVARAINKERRKAYKIWKEGAFVLQHSVKKNCLKVHVSAESLRSSTIVSAVRKRVFFCYVAHLQFVRLVIPFMNNTTRVAIDNRRKNSRKGKHTLFTAQPRTTTLWTTHWVLWVLSIFLVVPSGFFLQFNFTWMCHSHVYLQYTTCTRGDGG